MLSVQYISDNINGEIVGNPDFEIKGICDLEKGKKDCLTYIKKTSYEKYLVNTKASVIIVSKNFKIIDKNKIFIKVSHPGKAFIKVLDKVKYISSFKNKIEKHKSSDRSFDDNVIISENVYIGGKVKIGKNTTIYPGCYIGDHCTIGNNVTLFSNISIYDHTEIGNDCRIDAGTVIGSDGFGLINENNINYSIPHIGKVIIGHDVFIGSNCSIDRGTIGNTIIGNNCRLDNLIQIAHNVKVGNNCIIAGQAGIAGSTIIGDNVTIAGRAGIIDHLLIGDNSVITAHSLVCKSLEKNSFVSGNPAIDHKERLKQIVAIKKMTKYK